MNLIDSINRNIPTLKKAEIAGVLYLIKNNKLANAELVRSTGLPKEELKRLKSVVSELLEDSNADEISLSEKGVQELNKLELKEYNWSLYKGGEDQSIINKLKGIREKYNLSAKREYDQFFATEESSINKVSVMNQRACIQDKRVALLGDDDLVSSTIILFGMEPNSLTVLEIDTELLEKVKKISEELNVDFQFETSSYDVRKEIPAKFTGRFDTVVIDPPYTKSGVTLFLNRAVELLNGSDKYIFFYYGNSFKSPEKTLKVQEIINSMGLVIEDKIDKFSRYYGAESIGSASSLYVLKTTPFTKQLINPAVTKNIYTYEDRTEEKFPFVDQLTVKINKVPTNMFRSKSTLLSLFGKFCETHKLKVVDTVVTDFKNGGLTITYVLSNSNLVVHTWPEYNALHIDLITCTPIFKKMEIADTISKLFGTDNIEVSFIE